MNGDLWAHIYIYIEREREGIEICIYVYMYIRLTHYILSTGHMAPYAGPRVCIRAVGFIRADTAFIYIYMYISELPMWDACV